MQLSLYFRSSPKSFQMHKLRKGQWVPVILRVTSTGIERAVIPTGTRCALNKNAVARLEKMQSIPTNDGL